MHGTGIILGLIGTVAILAVASKAFFTICLYFSIVSLGLLVMLAISAAYNMWPVSPTKWLLRRFDHSAIYLLIAGTYAPFLALLKSGIAWTVFTTGIWSNAL